ncbi:MAG: hypothetical protein A2X46_05335 [Lentisphaerae bacterium GWF2_57_35]|nr:MAG: hypothetical protein A2X46_05335 [Lentisphaerae bacterium GWF2_57_35]
MASTNNHKSPASKKDEPKDHSRVNRLALEKSPYLLQHKHNPVDWYPWGVEAFQKAQTENMPIFLSIGYSTCHWCHVMERESFENAEIARLLNAHFVSIKVDREERPDLDEIYMDFVQASTGHGGWPMSVFLTPDRKPFFGGAYFPAENLHGQPGFRHVLTEIHNFWTRRQQEVLQSAEEISRQLRRMAEPEPSDRVLLSPSILKPAAAQLKTAYDPRYGGFGRAPKFPQPGLLQFLLSYGALYHDQEAIDMVLTTCDRMAEGGLYDQLGGGFSRYSIDEQWQTPHFEKMLYDNALLLQLYLDAFQASGKAAYAKIARSMVEYVLRDMTHEAGGFFSAEDADSEGKEGRFYCWTEKEMADVLPPQEFELAKRYFDLTEAGNFVDHSDPNPLLGLNVLHVADHRLSEKEQADLESAKKRLFESRSRRIRPHRDDKILTSWNGLMLSAMAQAYAVLGDESYRTAAERNLAFLKTHVWDAASRTLYHRWRDGQRDQVQLLKSYAFLVQGALDLYQATLQPQHLDLALEIAEAMLQRFYDSRAGGFWQTPETTDDLIIRLKDRSDGAEPAGNSIAVKALLKLADITHRPAYKEAAEKTLYFYAASLQKQPLALPYLLQTAGSWFGEHRRVIVTGKPDAPETLRLLRAVHSVYQPFKTVLGMEGSVDNLAQSMQAKGPRYAAYVCVGTACQPPTADIPKLKELMSFTPKPRLNTAQ